MRLITAVLLLSSRSCASGQHWAVTRNLPNGTWSRTQMEVSYQFQLEVNNDETTGTTLDVLGNIDLDILDTLQETLPNGQAASKAEEPNVKFERVSSEIFSACFTKSKQCSLIRSTILVSYKGQKPEHLVENLV
jgi:hypothetical protein